VMALRKLADDIEAGTVVLNSVTTSTHATHEEFTVREITIEVLEEYPNTGPRMVGK
jgi:5,10-methenyltetrahydromethanopterin hydrogenase